MKTKEMVKKMLHLIIYLLFYENGKQKGEDKKQ